MTFIFSLHVQQVSHQGPGSQKRSIVFPNVKKPNFDLDACEHYRPISNLAFLSETVERLVALHY